jgi:hypothetical protein
MSSLNHSPSQGKLLYTRFAMEDFILSFSSKFAFPVPKSMLFSLQLLRVIAPSMGRIVF